MRKGIDVIQLLRGMAALLVCLFHMKGILPANKLGNTLFGGGSIGVPLFFMISGFIMYHTTCQVKPDSSYIVNFFKKRFIRIVPLYFICTLLYISMMDQWRFFMAEHPERLFSAFCFMPTFHVMLGPSFGMPPLAVGWSLNYEMYFYVLLGLSMLIPGTRWLLLGGFLIACVFLLPLLFAGYITSSLAHAYPFGWKYLNFMCSPVLLFFLFGVICGYIYRLKNITLPLWGANLLLMLSVLLFILSYTKSWLPLPGFWSYLLSCGLLLLACLLRDKASPISLPDFLIFPGDVSYSLYLIHPLVLNGIPKLSGLTGLNFQTTGWIYFLTLLLLILLLAHNTYQLMEVRLSKLINRLWSPERKFT